MCQGLADRVFVTPMLAPQLAGPSLGGSSCASTPDSSVSEKQFSFYESCLLTAPDGEFLCKCNPYKAAWYVENGLGDVVSAEGEEFKVKE